MEARFTIGELARIFDVRITTLRYYDEIGLLTPAYTDPQTHYRFYSTQQFERLSTIKYLRALAMPLTEIQDFFANRQVSVLQKMLIQQRQQIQKKQAELAIIEAKIKQRLSQIQTATRLPLGIITEIQKSHIYLQYLRRHFNVGDDIEVPISALRQQYQIGDELFLGKVGLSLSQSDFKAGQFQDYSSVFMLVEPEDLRQQTGVMTILPASHYLQILFQGSHSEAEQYYTQLRTYVKKQQLTICGDPLEITLIDYGVTNDPQQYVTKIMLPIGN